VDTGVSGHTRARVDTRVSGHTCEWTCTHEWTHACEWTWEGFCVQWLLANVSWCYIWRH